MLSVLYAFKIADKFYIDRLGYTGSVFITKVHEDIYFVEGIGSGAKFEKRRIEDFILDADGWYSTEIFGEKPIVSLVQMNLSLVQKTKCLLSMIQNSISLL